jgi:DNA-binding response OmpR family regulator
MLDCQAITLTRTEYRLLVLLVEHAGKIEPRATVLTQLWGHVPEKRTRTVDSHIMWLRRKLGIYADH